MYGNVTDINAGGSQQNGDVQDLYGFFHGHDYPGALADFIAVSGKPAMVPRYASGVWHSRWYDYANVDVAAQVEAYRANGLPLDTHV